MAQRDEQSPAHETPEERDQTFGREAAAREKRAGEHPTDDGRPAEPHAGGKA